MKESKKLTTAQRSELARRANLSRKSFGGGRPRKDDVPESVIKTYGRDLAVLRNYARLRGCSIKDVVNVFAWLLVHGGEVPARPALAPQGWRLFAR